MTEKRLARHNVVAAFDSFDAASTATDELAEAGIPAEEMSLLGREHEMRPGEGAPTETPGTTTTGLGRAAGAGIGGGALAGGTLGAIAGAAVTAIPGVGLAVGAGALYAGVAGATMGHITGGLLGVEAGARKSMMWAQSLQPFITRVREHDQVLVGVHTEDPERADQAAERLEQLEPIEVVRLEADESYAPPGDRAAIAGGDTPSSVPDQPGSPSGS